jgi:3-oxoacyl-[acyl-carrier protein] reductase
VKSAPKSALNLEGRTILVSGAGGGIGLAVSSHLMEAGARVLSVDVPGVSGPANAEHFATDLADADKTRELFTWLRSKQRRLDGIVHCVGITRDAVLWKLSDEDWSEVLRVNLDSAFYLMREAVPMMRSKGGTITLISSINGERGKFGQANYTASKAGLVGLARTAARELGRFGIRVNVIAPGLIRTPMTEELPEKAVEHALEESVLGRLGEPDDVAGVVHFLCSDLSRHMTGQVLRVDGGQLIG